MIYRYQGRRIIVKFKRYKFKNNKKVKGKKDFLFGIGEILGFQINLSNNTNRKSIVLQ